MSTITKIKVPQISENVLQGDIFKDVSYVYDIKNQTDSYEIIQFTFPHVVVLSQGCDLDFLSKLLDYEDAQGTETQPEHMKKFMISVLVAPFYELETLKSGDHLVEVVEALEHIQMKKEPFFSKRHKDIIDSDEHYRYHKLSFDDTRLNLPVSIIDFKHYFSVSVEYLRDNKSNRICRLMPLYSEQVTLKFSNYLSRVGFE